MKFIPLTLKAEKALSLFLNITNSKSSHLLKQLKKSNYEVFLIGPDPLFYADSIRCVSERNLVAKVCRSWDFLINEQVSGFDTLQQVLALLDELGDKLINFEGYPDIFVRRSRFDPNGLHFYMILQGNESLGLSDQALKYINFFYMSSEGFIPIHSSCVCNNDRSFLFLGPSGAGKSTIARICKKLGARIIDQDQNMVKQISKGVYVANGWGYSLRNSKVPIKAVFNIVKDTTDRIMTLSQTETAQVIADQVFTITGRFTLDEINRSLFNRISEFCRYIPGYELHFKKAPDFWQLIESELFKEKL